MEKYIKYKDDDNFKTYLKENDKTISDINEKWDKCNSKSATHLFLNRMKEEIGNYKEQEAA